MGEGLILLLFLAALAAFAWTRARRAAGLRVTGTTWATAMTAFILVVLVLWAAAHH